MPRRTTWATVATVLMVGYAAASTIISMRAPPARMRVDEFPNVQLITQDGVAVRFYDDLLKGKSVAINFIYTNCKDECPLETARMVQVQRLLGDRVGRDLYFYSISIDPWHDTPPVLKEYADKFHVGPGWLFLTGDDQDIRLVASKLGISYTRNLTVGDGHDTILMLGDEPTGQWMQHSAEDNPRFLAANIGTFFGWRGDQAARSYAEAKPFDLDQGAYLFRGRCLGCHTIGGGDQVGPDLAGVTDRRDSAWLTQYLAAPDRMLDQGDPIARALYEKYRRIPMPNLSLDDSDVAALIEYLSASGAR